MLIANRRRFLFGATALLAAPAIARASSLMPISVLQPKLWGDGVHDDLAALQWIIENAKPGEVTVIPRGSYLIKKPLDFWAADDVVVRIHDVQVTAGAPMDYVIGFMPSPGSGRCDFRNISVGAAASFGAGILII